MKEYDEVRNALTGQSDDYNIVCFLDDEYFKGNCKLIAVDLNISAHQQIVFQGKTGQNWKLYTILEKSKKQYNHFAKKQKKFFRKYKWLNTIN